MAMRKKFRGDYEVKYSPDPATGKDRVETVYTGKYFVSDAPYEKQRAAGRNALLSILLLPALFVLMGFLNSPGGRVFYVVLPYAAALLPIVYLFAAVIGFNRLERRVTGITLDKTRSRAIRSGMATAVLGSVCFVGSLVLMLSGGASEKTWAEAVFCACAALLAASGYLAARFIRSVTFSKEIKEPIEKSQPASEEDNG